MVEAPRADQLTMKTWEEIASSCPLWCSIRDLKYDQGRHEYVRGELSVFNDVNGDFHFYHPGLALNVLRVPSRLADEIPSERGILIRSQLGQPEG